MRLYECCTRETYTKFQCSKPVADAVDGDKVSVLNNFFENNGFSFIQELLSSTITKAIETVI